MKIIKQRDKRWFIAWDDKQFEVMIVLNTMKPRLHLKLPYKDWGNLWGKMLQARVERDTIKGRALLEIGPSSRIYEKENQKIKKWQKGTPFEFSEKDRKMGVKELVKVCFTEGIVIEFYFSREVYLQFEKDILQAGKELTKHLGRPIGKGLEKYFS